jgi:hypothetical protein
VARTKPPAPLQKLHEVLAPKVTKPLRSTAKLTLPEEPQLQTSRRGGGRVSAAAAMQQPVSRRVGKAAQDKHDTTQLMHHTQADHPALDVANTGAQPLQALG